MCQADKQSVKTALKCLKRSEDLPPGKNNTRKTTSIVHLDVV